VVNRFKSLLAKRTSGAGVELAERVNVAQLRKHGQGFKLSPIFAPVPEGVFQDGQIYDSPALALIQSALAESKIKARRVATVYQGENRSSDSLASGASDQEVREMVLNHEAGLYLPYPRRS